jgi:Ca2+-binding RTX toxin-like protein
MSIDYIVVNGSSSDDVIIDAFSNPNSNYKINGVGGNDTIYGSEAASCWLLGGSGDDWLVGGAKNDIFDGGSGADIHFGSVGSDQYLFGRNDGADEIRRRKNEEPASVGAIIFKSGIDPRDIQVSYVDGFNLKIAIANTADSILINHFGTAKSSVRELRFTDSPVVLDESDILSRVNLTGDGSSQRISGYFSNDTISGGEGNDTLLGQDGNDRLNGGSGNDSLIGGSGLDTVAGGLGDDIYVLDDSLDQLIEFSGEGVDTAIVNFATGAAGYTLSSGLENARLGSDTNGVLIGNSGRNRLLGLGGNDQLFGRSGSDYLTGGLGNDTLQGDGAVDYLAGGDGNDTYVFEAGDGIDFVNNWDSSNGAGDDTLIFKELDQSQLWFVREDNDLAISVNGELDTVVIRNWFFGETWAVDSIKVADTGKTLSADRVGALVSAMATFDPPAAGQYTLPATTQAALSNVMAASWV